MLKSRNTKGSGHTLEHKRLSKHQEVLLYSSGDKALTQVAQRGHEVSLFGDNQKLFGHGPGQPAIGVPA